MRYPPFQNLHMEHAAGNYRWDRPPQHRTSYRNTPSPYQPLDLSDRMMANYRLVRKLQPGGMSLEINIVEHRSTGKRYIEKQIANRPDSSRVEAEIAALRQVSDYGMAYNLNAMLQYAPGRQATHIILEYCNGGNLQDLTDKVRNRRERHSESFIWHVLVSCINALNLLHNGPVDGYGRQDPNWDTICHLDIKPENIYLQSSSERHPRVVLGDFGCAVSNSDIVRGRADLGAAPAFTPGWEAPENRFGIKTDSWQLGCVIQTMCLLSESPDMGALESRVPCGSRYSLELNSFVERITETNVGRRWNAEALMDVARYNLRRTMVSDREW